MFLAYPSLSVKVIFEEGDVRFGRIVFREKLSVRRDVHRRGLHLRRGVVNGGEVTP